MVQFNLSDGINKIEAVALGAGTLALAGTGAAITGFMLSRRKKTRKKAKKKTTKRKTTRKKRKPQPKYARTAGKAKDRSTRRIRMTKTGQPYIILKSGKARFIKKSSAKLSRKRKGGRY
jgi:hypothetical protein